MAQFEYKAIRADGAFAEGAVEAGGRAEALRRIEALGMRPVRLREAAAAPAKKASVEQGARRTLLAGRGRVTAKTLENFTRQLAGLLGAGVPLSRALRIVEREAASPAARGKWREIYDAVVDGAALAAAMQRSPEVFPRVYVAMVEAGEAGGFLDVVLTQIADFQAREKELRSRVVTALIYPSVLVTLAFAVMVFLLVFFIPRFQVMFEGFGASLPALTLFVIGAGEFATRYGFFVALGAAAAAVTVRKWMQTDSGRRTWQRALLSLPVLGPLTARFAMTRFCRMLGTLLGAGVPLIHSLRVARESIGNQTLVDAVSAAIDRVRQGATLSESLSDCPKLFPGSALEMIAVAEETGRLDSELVRIAAMTDGDLDRQLRTAVALAEPAILFMVAGVIGTMVVGMLLPIFSIQELIQ